MFKLEYDPRIIGCKKLPDGTVKKGIGNFIRDYSLDEFPQFLNVLLGDMSLIGPRPATPKILENMSDLKAERMKVRPGITGYAQAYYRNSITQQEKFQHDCYYVDHVSFLLDIKILLQTVRSVLKQENIYVSQDKQHKEKEETTSTK